MSEPVERRRIGEIGADELEPIAMRAEEALDVGPGRVAVEGYDPAVRTRLEQVSCEVRADEPAGAGDDVDQTSPNVYSLTCCTCARIDSPASAGMPAAIASAIATWACAHSIDA